MATKYNKNDNPLRSVADLANEVDWSKFKYKRDFRHLCDIQPDKANEKITIIASPKNGAVDSTGVVYVFVIKGKIFKIGSSTDSLQGRVGSYNTGKAKYRMHGTNSTTNYFALQTFLNIGEIINVYAYFPVKRSYTIFGEKGSEAFPSAKQVEKKVLRDFKAQHRRLPIGCTQI